MRKYETHITSAKSNPLGIFDTPCPGVEVPNNLTPRQTVKEHDSNATGDIDCTPTGMQHSGRTDQSPGDWMKQLRSDLTAFACCDLAIGIAPKTVLKLRQLARVFQSVVKSRINFKSDGLQGIHQPEINHHLNRLLTERHVDPVPPVAGCQPRNIRHSSKPLLKVVDQVKCRLVFYRKYEEVLRSRLQLLYRRYSFVERRRDADKPPLSNGRILPRRCAPYGLLQAFISSTIARQFCFKDLRFHNCLYSRLGSQRHLAYCTFNVSDGSTRLRLASRRIRTAGTYALLPFRRSGSRNCAYQPSRDVNSCR